MTQKEKTGRYPWGKEGENEKVTIITDNGTYEGTIDDFVKEINKVIK